MLLIDRQERPGRKILASGGGKCNVTNLSVSPDNYLGANPRFTRQALSAFTPEQMLAFLNEHGIALEEREHGQIFCRQGAEKLRDLLVNLARKNGADFLLGSQINKVRAVSDNFPCGAASATVKNDSRPTDQESASSVGESKQAGLVTKQGEARFMVETARGSFHSRSLLIACGGPAWPNLGATFAGKKFASLFGHGYITPRPALTPLQMTQNWPLHGLQGISINVTASAPRGPAFTLPILFTHRGISGPACLQASSYLLDGEAITLDFLPGRNFSQLLDDPRSGKVSPFVILRRLLPERLAAAILLTPKLEPAKDRKCAELARAARVALANAVQRHQAVSLPADFKLAESSSGGIDISEINPKTMESRLVPGLYFAGEVMDVCGQLGGYNLHWAWASAAAVGKMA